MIFLRHKILKNSLGVEFLVYSLLGQYIVEYVMNHFLHSFTPDLELRTCIKLKIAGDIVLHAYRRTSPFSQWHDCPGYFPKITNKTPCWKYFWISFYPVSTHNCYLYFWHQKLIFVCYMKVFELFLFSETFISFRKAKLLLQFEAVAIALP